MGHAARPREDAASAQSPQRTWEQESLSSLPLVRVDVSVRHTGQVSSSALFSPLPGRGIGVGGRGGIDGRIDARDRRAKLSLSDESEYYGSSCFASLVTDLSLGERTSIDTRGG